MNPNLRLFTEDKSEISILKTKANKAEVLLQGLNQKTDNQATRLETLKDTMTSKINEIKENLEVITQLDKIEQLKGLESIPLDGLL